MNAAPPQTPPSVDALRAQVRGRVIAPGETDYDRTRTIFYGGFDGRPGVIVRPLDASDVARVVRVARDGGHRLAVRSGGHSPAGHSLPNGGILLDLRDMTGLDIDVDDRSAWAETGLTAGEYTAATAAHGLATGFGDTSSVGLGGITLSGGIGFLVRKHGLTVDSLLAAEVVTADGRVRHTDEQSHPELFWALRGGGGNFGVVTRLRFRLHHVDGVVGGMLVLPATPEVLAGFMALSENAAEELSAIAAVMPAPPVPFVPDTHHGHLVLIALLAFAGPAADGEAALAPFRGLAPPIVDDVRPRPYPDIFGPEPNDYHPTAAAHTMFVDTVDAGVAETILAALETSDAPMRVVQLRALGGAMARVPVEATAFAHRRSRILANVAAFYDAPDQRPEREAWVARLARALRQSDTGAYAGFLADEGEARVRQAYPGPTWDRLATVKASYDPTNLFRSNHNIPPADT